MNNSREGLYVLLKSRFVAKSERYLTVPAMSELQFLKLLTGRTVLSLLQAWRFVTLKVRIVAVEEKALQSVGLEHDGIGHSFSSKLKICC